MPSVFSHAIAAVALGAVAAGGRSRAIVWGLGALCAVAPDLDVVTSYVFRIPYDHILGHRGLSHSLLLAAVLGMLAAVVAHRTLAESPSMAKLWVFFFVAAASHGLLDSMTDGGLGVAFFAPFDNTRYFLSWRPIPVSPMSVAGLMTTRGLRVIRWEFALFWPFAIAAALWDKRSSARTVIAALLLIAGTVVWFQALSL